MLSFYSYIFLWIICFEQALLLSVDVLSSTNYKFSGTIISLDCNYKGPIVGKWHVWAKAWRHYHMLVCPLGRLLGCLDQLLFRYKCFMYLRYLIRFYFPFSNDRFLLIWIMAMIQLLYDSSCKLCFNGPWSLPVLWCAKLRRTEGPPC